MNNARLNQVSVITIKKTGGKQLEWSWFETDSEFEYRGVMYDVVKTVVKKDFISYYCIPDYKESQISNTLDQIVQDYMAHSKQASNIKKLIEKLICICDTSILQRTGEPAICNGLTAVSVEFTPRIFIDIIVPPPRFL